MTWRGFLGLSIRNKLLLMVLLPLAVVLPLLGLALLWWSNLAIDSLLITKVRSDLAVAHGYFERVLGEVGTQTDAAAQSHALHEALRAGDAPRLEALLQSFERRAGLDFLRFEATPHDAPPASSSTTALAGVQVMTRDDITALAPQLATRLGITLVPTANAAPTERHSEDRALVLLAQSPVFDTAGRPLGRVQGGVLLNRNLGFIDHINEIVYPQGSLPFGSQGTATLFLDDVRITTNVRLFGSERAIGTRVSQTVRDTVLGRGQTWLDRAFVVNDWYVSAYEALTDVQGRRVGMLYVGYTERPFAWVKYAALAGIGVIFFAVMLAAAWVSLRLAHSIFRPLEQMARTMQAVESGEPLARVGPLPNRDELGQLAAHLDHLLDVVDDKTRSLQRWGEELDRKVAERTRDLEASNASLQVAQQQLVRSEKLAAIGQLTASIAHEVNNPIAVIQGNVDLLREVLGDAAQPVTAELRLIDEQVERMRLIVTQLLQFARPTEFAGYVEAVDLGQAIDASLVLTGHLLTRQGITVSVTHQATRTAGINRQELQQVLINLIVNAAQAMPEGGTLSLSTRDWDLHGVVVEVADTGPGLDEALLSRLFQPFVTGKKDGTGLGLWISRSLVERYGGDLRAANRTAEDAPLSPGAARRGAVFTVWLHTVPPGAPEGASDGPPASAAGESSV